MPATRTSRAAATATVTESALKPTKKPKAKRKKKLKSKKRKFTARTADRHELYQLSVQSPEEDVKFLQRVYKNARGKVPQHFREDFCGTGLLASYFIKRGKQFTAEGFDICPDTVAWGLEHNYEQLGDAASRMTFHVKDVREPSTKKPDIRCAQNFSYFVFKQRSELIGYLKSVYKDLAKDGVFVMDIYGGPDSMNEMLEERDVEEGFTYVWDQKHYLPATGDYLAYIHFEFKDGTKVRLAPLDADGAQGRPHRGRLQADRQLLGRHRRGRRDRQRRLSQVDQGRELRRLDHIPGRLQVARRYGVRAKSAATRSARLPRADRVAADFALAPYRRAFRPRVRSASSRSARPWRATGARRAWPRRTSVPRPC